jgi:hypothetical protein
VALRIRSKKSPDYLQNARIIARMVNESPQEVMAYWFFTPYTIPDQRLLTMLNPTNHEVALHVVNNPFKEWKKLEADTNRTIKCYTIHGTGGAINKLLWGRGFNTGVKIPEDFPLEAFQKPNDLSLDRERYRLGYDIVLKGSYEWIKEGLALSIHPDWLFSKTNRSMRGPFYDVLKTILQVDKELETLRVTKKAFFKIAKDIQEYEKVINPTEDFLTKLSERDIDIYTFLERKWCCPIANPSSSWVGEDDNVSLLEVKDYNSWLQIIGKKTRNMIRKAEKSGVKVGVVEPSDKLAEGIWKIYNETPIRQERAFTHYGESLATVTGNMYAAKNNTFIAASLEGELVGFIQILYGDQVAIVSNILSLQSHWDKALNNAMLAKAVEVCAAKGERWLMYGRIGNHPSLDKFKENNGFVKVPITRFYVPLTSRGRLAIRLGLHRDFKDSLPDFIKYPLIPTVNLISRSKVKAKMKLRKMKG